MGRNVSVERGAALLDEKLPGWENDIDLEKLDLAHDCKCVLGQLNGGDYYRGTRRIGLETWNDERTYGFVPQTPIGQRRRWENLTDAWRRLIRSRLAAP